MSNRRIASQFGVCEASVRRHFANHTSTRLVKAAERRDIKAADRLLGDLEFLWRESTQYVADAKKAVKWQKVTKETPLLDKDGRPILDSAGDPILAPSDVYQEFRDVNAMAPALNQAHKNRELFAAATGVGVSASHGSVNLVVVMPKAGLPSSSGQVLDIPSGPIPISASEDE